MTASELWTALLGELHERLEDEEFSTWFRPLRVVEQDDPGVLRLLAPNEHFTAAIQTSYGAAIADSLTTLQLDRPVRVDVVLPEGPARAERQRAPGPPPAYQVAIDALAALPERPDYAEVRYILEEDLPPLLRDATPLLLEEIRQKIIEVLAGKSFGSTMAARWADRALGRRGDLSADSSRGLFPVDDPWPEQVDTAVLLDAVATQFTRYVVLPPGGSVALPLWVLFTHAIAAFSVAPRLALTSPTPRCGKSSVLELLALLCRRALHSANVSTAFIYRAVDEHGELTLLIDEADTFLAEQMQMKGILNTGHVRGTLVARTDGENFQARGFACFCPVAIALIGTLDGHLASLGDRSIELKMRRRSASELVEQRKRGRDEEGFGRLRRMAARWAEDGHEQLCAIDPAVPPELNDRAADNWRPLLAIAQLAGGSWPARARQAALVLSCGPGEGSAELLLADIRQAFDEFRSGAVSSKELVGYLTSMEERPWPDWRGGRPLTACQLAAELRRFGIRPVVSRNGGRVADQFRGYRRAHFEEAWARYCPDTPPSPPAGCHTVTRAEESMTYEDSRVSHAEPRVTPCIPSNPLIPNAVLRCDTLQGGEGPPEVLRAPKAGGLEPFRAYCMAGLRDGWLDHQSFRGAAEAEVQGAIAAIEAAGSLEAIEAALAALVKEEPSIEAALAALVKEEPS